MISYAFIALNVKRIVKKEHCFAFLGLVNSYRFISKYHTSHKYVANLYCKANAYMPVDINQLQAKRETSKTRFYNLTATTKVF
jgi:hypothetical protein